MLHPAHHDEMSEQDKGHGPQRRLPGIGRERAEIAEHVAGVAVELSQQRGKQILQAPACHHGIEAQDDGRGENAQIAHEAPRAATGEVAVGTGGIALRAPSDDELAHHARNAQQHDAAEVNDDESSPTVLPRHKWEPPHIAQPYGRACRSQDNAHFTCKTASVAHGCTTLFSFKSVRTDAGR